MPDFSRALPWPGENEPTSDNLVAKLLLFESPAGADRTLAAEGQEAAEIGIGRQHVERRLAAVVGTFGNAVAVADHLHVRDSSS